MEKGIEYWRNVYGQHILEAHPEIIEFAKIVDELGKTGSTQFFSGGGKEEPECAVCLALLAKIK